jgi:bidirectional [NiFe] hydrogenase diaphorase subunit
MNELLGRVCGRTATAQDKQLLEELCDLLRNTSMCGLGQSAPNPVLSTLKYFAEEYRAHIDEHRCPAGVCGNPEHEVVG